MINTKKPI